MELDLKLNTGGPGFIDMSDEESVFVQYLKTYTRPTQLLLVIALKFRVGSVGVDMTMAYGTLSFETVV